MQCGTGMVHFCSVDESAFHPRAQTLREKLHSHELIPMSVVGRSYQKSMNARTGLDLEFAHDDDDDGDDDKSEVLLL